MMKVSSVHSLVSFAIDSPLQGNRVEERNPMDLKSIRLEAWTDGERDVCAFHLDRTDAASGLRHVWFVLESSELDSLASGTAKTLEDGYHRLSVFGESCIFFDFEYPRGDAGEIKCPYLRLDLPRAFWRYLRVIARAVWRAERAMRASIAKDDGWRIGRTNVGIPLATLERFQARYGHGKGKVTLDACPRFLASIAAMPEVNERTDAYGSGPVRTLADNLDKLQAIARNYTRNVYQETILHVTDDGAGFYWYLTKPSNDRRRIGLNGGLYNHGKDGAQDWSIHT